MATGECFLSDGPAPVVGLDAVLYILSPFTTTILDSSRLGQQLSWVGWLAWCSGPDLHPNFLLFCPCWVVVYSRRFCVLLMYPQYSPLQTEGCLPRTPANSTTEEAHTPGEDWQHHKENPLEPVLNHRWTWRWITARSPLCSFVCSTLS